MLNAVEIIGYLGATPELRYTATGTPVANLRVATTEKWRDDKGDLHERTEWHGVVVWGATASACAAHLGTGHRVFVRGRLQTREWERDGQQHRTTEVVAERVLFLGKPDKSSSSTSSSTSNGAKPSRAGAAPDNCAPPPVDDSEIPF